MYRLRVEAMIEELLAYGILFSLIGVAILVCTLERRKRYRGLLLPKRKK